MQDTGKHRGGDQIRIGVGPGNAMLNAHVGLVAVRDAHRHGAVVETPAIVERHERVEYEAAVTVAVWRKQQHAIARHLLQAAKDRKSTRLNSSHYCASRMPSSACKQNTKKK